MEEEMKKRVLVSLLSAAMVATMFAGCGKTEETQKPESQASQKQEENNNSGSDEAVEPLYHFALDGTDEGLVVVERVDDKGANTGANYGIAETTKDLVFADGPVGKCLRFDGSFGIKLPMEDKIDGNEYTLSFWVNADRLGTFGPTLQLGHNIGMDVADATVTWMNFTQTEWGASNAKLFPVVWNRNSANDTFPWTASYDDTVHGKKEWIMVTVVADGQKYEAAADGAERIHSKLYIDGQLMTDSLDETLDGYAGFAPDIFTASYGGFEAYLGINYWDSVFKGFMDEVYVYNKALSDNQVADLFKEGNKNVESKADDAAAEEDQKPAENPTVTAQGTLVGATDFTTDWWTTFTDTFKVESGATVTKKVINYHAAECSNWNTPSVVLQNVADAHSADANAAYKEYGVVRTDNWGWLGADNTGEKLDVLGWELASDWNWDTFAADTQGATFEIAVTNNGTTADVVLTCTSADGATKHTQSYKNIKVDGDLYFCFALDHNVLDIIQ